MVFNTITELNNPIADWRDVSEITDPSMSVAGVATPGFWSLTSVSARSKGHPSHPYGDSRYDPTIREITTVLYNYDDKHIGYTHRVHPHTLNMTGVAFTQRDPLHVFGVVAAGVLQHSVKFTSPG
jgi:hypothetical protein